MFPQGGRPAAPWGRHAVGCRALLSSKPVHSQLCGRDFSLVTSRQVLVAWSVELPWAGLSPPSEPQVVLDSVSLLKGSLGAS